jgi:hypothetical protein
MMRVVSGRKRIAAAAERSSMLTPRLRWSPDHGHGITVTAYMYDRVGCTCWQLLLYSCHRTDKCMAQIFTRDLVLQNTNISDTGPCIPSSSGWTGCLLYPLISVSPCAAGRVSRVAAGPSIGKTNHLSSCLTEREGSFKFLSFLLI